VREREGGRGGVRERGGTGGRGEGGRERREGKEGRGKGESERRWRGREEERRGG
jgi:hypothetical protein